VLQLKQQEALSRGTCAIKNKKKYEKIKQKTLAKYIARRAGMPGGLNACPAG